MDQVHIVEVGPRDGLQNEKKAIPVDTKVELVERLSDAGFATVEAGAFVSPKWVPQMASSDEVMQKISRRQGVSYPVLVPNLKGYERAKELNIKEIAVFAAASEAFSQKNTNASIEDVLERSRQVIESARADGVSVRGYVSCVLGCPYEGEVAVSQVVRVSRALLDMGCHEISLGDTIGVGTPGKTRDLIRAISEAGPLSKIAGHFHDTYGQALANIYAALEEGVRVFDASISGLGGCPYAAGASGNVATEDLVFMLNGLGMETGVSLEALFPISEWISNELERPVGSKVTLARVGR